MEGYNEQEETWHITFLIFFQLYFSSNPENVNHPFNLTIDYKANDLVSGFFMFIEVKAGLSFL